ncbi:hypothetical protein N9917_00365 [Deltaproteobacteria bacterium]|nr:hypothetical protein [Deltaproteobacteria bacterium]
MPIYVVTVNGEMRGAFTDRLVAATAAGTWVEYSVFDGTEVESRDGKIYWSNASYMKSWKRGKLHFNAEYDDEGNLLGFEGSNCTMTITETEVLTEAPTEEQVYRELYGEEPPWLTPDPAP